MTEKMISSADNAHIKRLRKLSLKKYRDEYREYAIENATTAFDAGMRGFPMKELFVSPSFREHENAGLAKLLHRYPEIRVIDTDENILRKVSQLDSFSGMIAVYAKAESKIDLEKNIIYCNGISDPGNLGNIIRSAVAFGLCDIVFDEVCADVYNIKTLHAAKDSFFFIRHSHDRDRTIWDRLRAGMKTVATDANGEMDIRTYQWPEPCCIVLGNESRGVDQKIGQEANVKLRIGIEHIDSLNVASAAAILFFDKKRASNMMFEDSNWGENNKL